MDIAAQPEIKDKDPGSKQNEILAAAHVRTGTPASTCKRIGKSPASPPVSQGPIPELQRSHQGTTSQLKIKGREGINFGAVEMPCLREMVQGSPGTRIGPLLSNLQTDFLLEHAFPMHVSW